jgi:acyl-CoA synthetase (NDP forming)
VASNTVLAPTARDNLDSFFHPQSIVLFGGSRNPESMGGTLLRNICGSFQGPLYLVHPHVETLAGRRVFKSLAEIPEPIELAIIAVPAAAVEATVEQCLAKRVRAIVLITAGFAELNSAGRAAETRLMERISAAGVRLLGPNCLGVLNNEPAAPLNATFSHGQPPVGDIGVCTQSGALGFVFPDYMRRWNLGVSQLVSLGNKADVGENDVLAYWSKASGSETNGAQAGGDGAKGSETNGPRAIQVYLESFQDPRGFLAAVRPLARRRPVAVLLGGRTAAGSRAAGSHTAALASPDALARGAVRQSGAILVDSMVELFDVTAMVAMQPLPQGRRVAVLTNAGGPGVLCADALEAHGLSVPGFSAELQARLRALSPPQASVANPVDLIGSTSPDLYSATLRELLQSDEVDQIAVIYVPRLPNSSGPIATALRQTLAACRTAAPRTEPDAQSAGTLSAGTQTVPKTIAAVFMESSGAPTELRDAMGGIPAFAFPENAAQALAAATRYAEWRAAELREVNESSGASNAGEPSGATDETNVSGEDRPALGAVQRIGTLASARTVQGFGRDWLRSGPAQRQPLARLQAGIDGWLPPPAVQAVLREADLAIPAWGFATTEDEALAAAESIGWPVVVKAVADSVLHKARAGGVVVDVRTPTELANAVRRLRQLALDVRGVFLQAFVPGGRELFVGLRRDPRFGLVIGCGRGGTEVETQGRVAFRMLPATRLDLQSLVADAGLEHWLKESLVCDTLAKIAALGESFVELLEADFNPLSLRPGHAPMVLDARIRLRTSGPSVASS